MLIVIFSEKTRSPISNVGYMDREGMNLGSATKEQNAKETTTATNIVFASSAVKFNHSGKIPSFFSTSPTITTRIHHYFSLFIRILNPITN
jgi:hypothetical protein